MEWDCAGKVLDLRQPVVMGVLNVTPDSFSDGGHYTQLDDALRRAEAMVAEGAAIIDVGGESTRPGAPLVPVAEELARVLPVIERLARVLPVPISVDTSKPEVMRAAASAGAGLINDVWALRQPGALAAAAATGLPVCLMHMQGEPLSMQHAPAYADVVAEVRAFLCERVEVAKAAGIAHERLLLDPGFGFGKTLEHNLALLARLDETAADGLPLLAGMSRKTMLGEITGRPVGERLAASITAHLLAAQKGASILRVHDVAAMRDALAVWEALKV